MIDDMVNKIEKRKEFLKKLISIFHTAGKDLKRRKEIPSKFNILKEISGKPEVAAILAETVVSDILPNEYYVPQDTEAEILTQKIIELTQKLNALEIETKACRQQNITLEKRISLENTYFIGVISKLVKVLSRKLPGTLVEKLYDLRDTAVNKKSGLKERFFEFETAFSTVSIPLGSPACEDANKEGAECVLTNHIETYRDIIVHLKQNLTSVQLEQIEKIENGIQSIAGLEDYYVVNNEILNLIKSYTVQVNGNLDQAARFIFEISTHLFDVEKSIKGAVNKSDNFFKSNTDFNLEMEKHMLELTNHVNFSKTLSEMKTAVVSSLSNIKTSLDRKKKIDKLEKNEADGHIRQLREQLSTTASRLFDLEKKLLRDELTGCYSFFAYENRVSGELERFKRYRRTFSILLFDVDRFKSINDNYGHLIGDKCLKEIISRVRHNLRKADLLARYSGAGDEFLLLLPETGISGALDAAEKIRAAVESIEFIHKSKTIKITISIGVTEVKPSDETHDDIFTRADAAMYKSKNMGGNAVNTSD